MSPFHTFGNEYYLFLYNRLLEISENLAQLHPNQLLDGLQHFQKSTGPISEPLKLQANNSS